MNEPVIKKLASKTSRTGYKEIILLPLSHNSCYICICISYIKCNNYYGTDVMHERLKTEYGRRKMEYLWDSFSKLLKINQLKQQIKTFGNGDREKLKTTSNIIVVNKSE